MTLIDPKIFWAFVVESGKKDKYKNESPEIGAFLILFL